MSIVNAENPFKPGAGHMPPFLAGREKETQEFFPLLDQTTILENLIVTGLRGVGKTVLLEKFKPLAVSRHWLWVGTDLSQSASVSEERLATRLITDLSMATSDIAIDRRETAAFGFKQITEVVECKLDYDTLMELYNSVPGLASDKLKGVLEFVWRCVKTFKGLRGVVFAYDEAQTISDHPENQQYPLSLLLDVFQSLQRKDIPWMLILTGLPTLFPRLVEARTFSERMFKIIFVDSLNEEDCRDAIVKPVEKRSCPIRFSADSIKVVVQKSGGYPYFIQFICKEAFDMHLQRLQLNITSEESINIKSTIEQITGKLDNDFYAGRWARTTDRQRELMQVIAGLTDCDKEFTVQGIVEASKTLPKPFSASHVNQMLATLTGMGLVYKNRHGRYSFAVPLLGQYIRRQMEQG